MKTAKDAKETIEPPPFEFEYVFVPDFMKDESLPERFATRPATTVEVAQKVAVKPESESLYLPEVRKTEPPSLITSAPCDEIARPGREAAKKLMLS